MSEGVKETLCTRCEHREVCMYKLDYLNILKKVIDYDFISGISVGCRYYRNWTDTYRDGDSQCLTF